MNLSTAYKLITDKLVVWAEDLVRIAPNILLAAIILVIGIFISKWIRLAVSRILKRISHHQALTNLFVSIIYVFCLGITLFIALSILKLDKAVTSILAGAGILGLALAFAFQDIASNFISGIFISFRSPIHIGDIVQIKEYMGTVTEINLRDTHIQTFQGHRVIIPNKDVFQNPIENYSTLGKRRFDLSAGVSYGDDLEKVRTVTLEALAGLPNLAEGEHITLYFQEFGGSTINYTLRFWLNTADQETYLLAGSEAILRLKKAYDRNGITLPFPITTLDFGIKGGKSLDQAPISIRVQSEKPSDNS